jgi:hypothetical protein
VQRHFELLEQFKACVKKFGPDISAWQDSEARDCLLSFILHCCDISNGLRAMLLAADWAARITQGKLLPHYSLPKSCSFSSFNALQRSAIALN